MPLRPSLLWSAICLRNSFSPSPDIGTKGCLAAIIACTVPSEPPCVNTPSKWPCTASASAVTFCDVAVTVDRITRQAAHLEDIAGLLARFINEPFGRHAAHLLLVLVDHHHLV